ncbi:ABC transporter substrate-binding protein [Streptomyces antnestii]|uniref:ABC transporter substrate-binding protein n=1 Tax=Streptomyces antnestii TaxID=2494256 RepID=A0A437PL46_9ACTN|nr:ABC transporter substrate-binding protein [Streptomyces sp. San01]RVU23028.1 ABC transporter substrate-binding protein [Streptomyces sp. San01]
MTPIRRRATLAAVGVLSLVLAACGSRVDHDTVVRSVGSGGNVATGAAGADSAVGADGSSDSAAGGGTKTDGSSGSGSGTGGGGGGGGGGGSASGGGGKPGAKGGGGPIVIGSVGTTSGPGGVAFAQGPRALQAWAATVNAGGGINGRKVQVIVMDDGGDASKGRSQMQELVEQRKAVAIVASFTTTQTMNAWRSYVEQKKVPVIGGDCSTTAWNESPMLFSECPGTNSVLDGLAQVGAKYGKGKKLGALICTDSDACTHVYERFFGSGNAAKRYGLDPVYSAKISVTQPDFTAECIQARNAGVQLMLVAGDPNTVSRVASSCSRQNFSPQFLQPGATVDGATASKPGLKNVLAVTPVFPFKGSSAPGSAPFTSAWSRYGDGKAPGPAAAQGWASAKVFEKAARGAGEITRAGLIKELTTFRGQTFDGLTVPLTYVAGQGSKDTRCAFAMRGAGGGWMAMSGGKAFCW